MGGEEGAEGVVVAGGGRKGQMGEEQRSAHQETLRPRDKELDTYNKASRI